MPLSVCTHTPTPTPPVLSPYNHHSYQHPVRLNVCSRGPISLPDYFNLVLDYTSPPKCRDRPATVDLNTGRT